MMMLWPRKPQPPTTRIAPRSDAIVALGREGTRDVITKGRAIEKYEKGELGKALAIK